MLAATALLIALAQGPKPDGPATAAFEALAAHLGKAASAKATIEVRSFNRVDTYEFRFLRPNFAKAVSKESLIIQNGETFFDFNPLDNEYFTRPAPAQGLPAGTAFSLGGLAGLEGLGFSNEPKWIATALVRKSYSGIPAQAIVLRGATDPNLRATVWVDAGTGLPLAWDYSLQDFKAAGRIKNLTLGHPLKPSDFAWKPPAGAKKVG